MGSAIAEGLLRAGQTDIEIVETNEAARAALSSRIPNIRFRNSLTAADEVVLAVKPKDVASALDYAKQCKAKRVLSIIAGITLMQLQSGVGNHTAVIRAMPNIGALVGKSATAYCCTTSTDESDAQWAHGVLAAVGNVVRVDESLIDAVTGLSGSGPAYVFLIAEAMIEAGLQVGLPLAIAKQLTSATLHASAGLLEDGEPEALRRAVTTPGGTTEAGIRVLESHHVRAAFVQAVAAATERSKELGAYKIT